MKLKKSFIFALFGTFALSGLATMANATPAGFTDGTFGGGRCLHSSSNLWLTRGRLYGSSKIKCLGPNPIRMTVVHYIKRGWMGRSAVTVASGTRVVNNSYVAETTTSYKCRNNNNTVWHSLSANYIHWANGKYASFGPRNLSSTTRKRCG